MIEIISERFRLRELNETDVSERYLSWFSDAAAKANITAASTPQTLASLRQYVRDRLHRRDIIFLGIFDKASGLHIGNIKYEPIDTHLGYAVMGLLIGEPDYRYKGVAHEVLMVSAKWLKEHRKLSQIILGVDHNNIKAIRAYEKVGFIFAKTEFLPNHPSTMVWDLDNIDVA